MKAINYADIKRVYSDTPITLELVDGTTYKAYEFEFMNDEQINNSDDEMLVEMIEVKDDTEI